MPPWSTPDNIDWLRNFYQRFDEDVKLLHQRESTWLVCKRCPDGYCCGKGSYVSLNVRGSPFLIEDWWRLLEHVRDKFTPADKEQLAKNVISKRRACIFLLKNRCGVYECRPWWSRIYPYTINFAENNFSFPVGNFSLPSCPALAPGFGLKTGGEMVQKPQVLEHHRENRLVKVKLRKHKPIWLIDASDYVVEFEKRSLQRTVSQTEIESLLILAEEAGGFYGGLLRIYLETVLGIRTNVRLVPPDRSSF